MWTDNEDGTFTAENGDTLWDLYGADWQEKSGYTGDPAKLQAGDTVGKKNEQFSKDLKALPYPNLGLLKETDQRTQQSSNSTWDSYAGSLEIMAGTEMVAMGSTIAGGGAYAIGTSTAAIVGGSGSIAAAGGGGAVAAGFAAGAFWIVIGVGLLGMGVDMIEGNGLDHTMNAVNKIMKE
jgi:hypothetical protein